jgi:PAS domain S-box-containing protein
LRIEHDHAERKAHPLVIHPLSAEERLYSRLVNSLDGIVWEADPQTLQFTFVSSQAERILGYPVAQWLDEPHFWQEHTHPDDVEWCVNFCVEATSNRRDHEFEYRMLAADGGVVWLHDIVTVTVEPDGSARLRGIMIDITERRNAEEALRRNEELFRAIVEDQTEMIVRWQPDGTRTFVNQAYCRVFGKRAEELVGSSFYPLVAEKYREAVREKIRSLTPDKPLATEIHESISPNGEVCWQEWTDRGIFDAQGKLIELQSTGRDITERKRAEEALRLSENRYRRIVQMAPEAIVVADMATGRFVDFNPQALALFKLSADEILNLGPVDMSPAVQPDGRASTEAARTYTERALAGETPVFEWMHRNSCGEDIPCEVRLLQLPDESRLLVRGTITDITERKQAEGHLKATSDQLRALMAALRRAREDEGVRIARQIHDELGSALTSLRWDLETIDRAVAESGYRTSAAELRERIEVMTGLIDDTLNVIRRISAELRPSVLDDLGLAAAIEWQAQQFEARTGIICNCECSLENLDLNPEQATAIFRIFQEALTNVMRHAAANRIDTRMEKKDGMFVLTIADNGKGITESEKMSRSSLGLLGMRERAQLIGGEVHLNGIAGEGTTVTVQVPIFNCQND